MAAVGVAALCLAVFLVGPWVAPLVAYLTGRQ